MKPNTYLWILRAGIYASLLVVFLVIKSFLFPFITSKQLIFNLMIEFLMIFWIALIVKYPEYRPKWNYITGGLAAFFVAIIISAVLGVDFNLSFWGDIERMLGVFHILHFFAFYLIIITVFRSWRDWMAFFIASVTIAVLETFTIINKNPYYGTIGNTAYVSGYIIFQLYFITYLIMKMKSKLLGLGIYAIPTIFLIVAFSQANTTGAHVGLAAGIFFTLLLYVLLQPNKKIKTWLAGAFLLLVLSTGWLYANRWEPWVADNSVLSVLKEIDFKKNTFMTRLISWQAAWQELPEHPVFGNGFGNYSMTFDRFFDPSFYNYTRSETYFDRAHNNVVDIASTSGLVGLLAYLLIFVAAEYYLIAGYLRKRLDIHDFALTNGLIAAYFVQNLAVFDSLVTYMGIMATLAYVYWLYHREELKEAKPRPLDNPEIYALAAAGAVLAVIMFQFNYKPIVMLQGTIEGQRAFGGPEGLVRATEVYKKALSHETVLDRDSRTSYVRSVISSPDTLKQLPKEKAAEIGDYTIALAEANVKMNPGDSMNQMILSQALITVAGIYTEEPAKFEYYYTRSLEAIDASIAASPRRTPIYFQKAQIYLTAGNKDKALETLEYAVSLNEDYPDSFCYLARIQLFFKVDESQAWGNIDKCIDKGGMEVLNQTDFLKFLLGHYRETGNKEKQILILGRLTQLDPKEVSAMIEMAKLLAEQGRIDEAIGAAQKAVESDPSVRPYAEKFINELMAE